MSDKVRCDFTPEEARKVREAIAYRKVTCNWSTPELDAAFEKIQKAEGNPLNGPTFPARADLLSDYFHGTHERDLAPLVEEIPEEEIPL